MPFAVLLEVALQACGWMAAYMGSALTSDGDLKFRNLGGTGRQHLPVTRHTGTLTTRVRVDQDLEHGRHDPPALTNSPSIAGMAWFMTAAPNSAFSIPDALEQQVGIREAAPYQLSTGGTRRRRVVRVSLGCALP